MKFRISTYISGLLFAGIAVFSMGSFMCCLGAFYIPHGRKEFIIMMLITIIGLVASFYEATSIAFPWISFNQQGIYKKWHFGVDEHIPWSECAEIGIMRLDFGSHGIHNAKNFLYFSKIPLLDKSRVPKAKKDSFIMLECRPEVLVEVLHYVEKEKILNRYLLYTAQK